MQDQASLVCHEWCAEHFGNYCLVRVGNGLFERLHRELPVRMTERISDTMVSKASGGEQTPDGGS